MVGRLLALAILLMPLRVLSQTTVTGHITDVRTGEPLIGVSVIVKDAKGKGVVTDLDGNFRLTTKAELPLTLSVQYMG